MSNLLWKALGLSPAFLAATLLLPHRTLAQSATPSGSVPQDRQLQQIDQYNQAPSGSQTTNQELQQIDQYNQSPTAPVAQVTSVSQLSDVRPTDWAFQALQSLVERYGCIAGYPDGTYRGNRALTRYEFAAGLNACLNRVNELIQAGTADLVRKEDLATLQRLQEEFAAELATLRGRVDNLEARTAELEANQFSTTTKLAGEAIFALNGFGNTNNVRDVLPRRAQGSNGRINNNETFSDRVRLALNTSFSGRDLLRTRLQARNTTPFNSSVTGTNETRLGFDGDEGNTVAVDQLFYRFPLGKKAVIQIDAANTELNERGFPTFSPFESSGTGSISRYGRFSPIYRIGNSSTGSSTNLASAGAGASIHINPQGPIGLDLAYLAPTANNPNQNFGLGSGSYAAVGQIDFNASKFFSLGLTYAHGYDTAERRNGSINVFDNTGSLFSETPFGNIPTTTNNYGVEASIRPNQHVILFGWGGYTQAIAEKSPNGQVLNQDGSTTTLTGHKGSQANIWYYAGGLAFPDIGSQGSMLGFLFGQEPRLAGTNVTETFVGAGGTTITRRRTEPNVSYHAEAFYRYRLTDNIDITPGVIVIFNPEGNYRNPTDYVGTLRTTFRF